MTTATGRMIGKCFTCKRVYVAESLEQASTMFCDCCANGCIRRPSACFMSYGGQPHAHPVSAIKWATIKTRHSAKRCSGACTSAKSDSCVCECDGANHGRDYAL